MSEEILIVDDNADIRNIINELIIDAGYKTRLAANYNQALAEKSSRMGSRKKFRNLQAWLGVLGSWLGVPGQVWPRPDFQVGPKTSKMARNGSGIDDLE